MKSSSKTDQTISDQSKMKTNAYCLLNQFNNELIKNPISKTSKNLNSFFFKPNLLNLINLIGLMICLSFYTRINHLENQIQQIELNCKYFQINDHLQSTTKIDLKKQQQDASLSIKTSNTHLPLSIVEFVDQVFFFFIFH